MPPENRENQLLQVLRKIPLFKGLDPQKIKKILGLCIHKVYQPEQLVCRSGAPSDELYILLSGELAVVTSENVKLASIKPVTTVGEMGVITAQPRSAYLMREPARSHWQHSIPAVEALRYSVTFRTVRP